MFFNILSSYAICWSFCYFVLSGLYWLFCPSRASCEKRVQRTLFPLDDLHGINHILSSSLWSLDHYWLLHCKFIYQVFPLNMQKFVKLKFYFSALECICLNLQLDMDGWKCKTQTNSALKHLLMI